MNFLPESVAYKRTMAGVLADHYSAKKEEFKGRAAACETKAGQSGGNDDSALFYCVAGENGNRALKYRVLENMPPALLFVKKLSLEGSIDSENLRDKLEERLNK